MVHLIIKKILIHLIVIMNKAKMFMIQNLIKYVGTTKIIKYTKNIQPKIQYIFLTYLFIPLIYLINMYVKF